MVDAHSFDLERFTAAQSQTFTGALNELRAGEKHSHWMWFIFPQLRGLGRSAMAQLYGIESLREAQAYLDHPILGPRLILSTEAVLGVKGRTVYQIFGSPDDLKFCSSMTLFHRAAGDGENVFRQALEDCCAGEPDARTLTLLDP